MQRAGTRRKSKNYIKVNKRFRIVIAMLACLIFAGASLTVYSKYYKTGYNKGMAIASGFYFSSNYMASLDEIKGLTMEEIAENYLDSIIISANRTAWQGEDAYSFQVEIRNYDNQLLYNDRDLNVEYQVNFMLLEEPQGATYTVKSADGKTQTLVWQNGKGSVASFTGKLAGGVLKADIYELIVGKTADGSAYVPSNVLMVAYPTGPDYLINTKYIAGIVKANYEEREFKIESGTGFTVSKTTDYETDWKAAIEKESGFVYQLITSGKFTGSEVAATRKKIRLKWNSDMFKINENDDYYLSVKGTDQCYSENDNGINWQVMEIEVLPYASLKFVFFRNNGFETKVAAMSDSSEFEDSIKVEVLP